MIDAGDFATPLGAAKNWFFDRAKVLALVEKKRLRVMRQAGGFTRTTARRSIRKRKAASTPGNPPSSHSDLLKDFIFFAYDPSRDTVVVGPTPLNWIHFQVAGGRAEPGLIPKTLEHGGSYRVIEEYFPPFTSHGEQLGGYWRRLDLRRRGSSAVANALLAGRGATFNDNPTRIRTVTILPRPYMRPAAAKAAARFVGAFKDSVGLPRAA